MEALSDQRQPVSVSSLRFMPSHGRASSRDDAVQEIGSRFSTVPDEILARVKVGRVIPARTDDGNASPA